MILKNKKAHFNYILSDRFEAGISLTGKEVKTLRQGRGDLGNAYVRFLNGELYLVNAVIPVEGDKGNPTRSRKLLMHKKELVSIRSRIEAKKLTLVPTKLYNRGPLIKLEVALAKSKRKFEKKESIKKKDLELELKRELFERGK